MFLQVVRFFLSVSSLVETSAPQLAQAPLIHPAKFGKSATYCKSHAYNRSSRWFSFWNQCAMLSTSNKWHKHIELSLKHSVAKHYRTMSACGVTTIRRGHRSCKHPSCKHRMPKNHVHRSETRGSHPAAPWELLRNHSIGICTGGVATLQDHAYRHNEEPIHCDSKTKFGKHRVAKQWGKAQLRFWFWRQRVQGGGEVVVGGRGHGVELVISSQAHVEFESVKPKGRTTTKDRLFRLQVAPVGHDRS